LHAFSGSLPAGPYIRCDSRQEAELPCSVNDVPDLITSPVFDLVLADPPYSDEHAKRYGTPMVDRLRATRSLARVTRRGGFLAWLDERWPMHRKTEWITVGRIFLETSTNRRVRKVSIFERAAA